MRAAAVAALLLLAGCVQSNANPSLPATSAPNAMGSTGAIVPAGNPAIGGTTIPLDRSIAADLALAPTLSILVRALEVAGMTNTLQAGGPFTIFAPSDAAFARLQPGTIEALMKSEHRTSLTRLLGLHIVPERLDAVELMRRVGARGGQATVSSVAGEAVTITLTSGIITLTDAGGNKSYVETADVRAVNGVIHVVNGVLVPRLD